MNLVTIDYTGIPHQLLPIARSHCRVDSSLDDQYLMNALTRAISQFEIMTECRVFPAEYTWLPQSSAYANGGWRSPIAPVRDFKAFVNAVDVSADYSFTTDNPLPGTGTWYLMGENQDGLSIQQFKTGYLDACLIPPGIVDRILHWTATYYENRELFIPQGQFMNPLRPTADFAGWWVPKA